MDITTMDKSAASSVLADLIFEALECENDNEAYECEVQVYSVEELPIRTVNANYLQDLITIFCWLDAEHQSRSVSALNNVLADQMAEIKATKSERIIKGLNNTILQAIEEI